MSAGCCGSADRIWYPQAECCAPLDGFLLASSTLPHIGSCQWQDAADEHHFCICVASHQAISGQMVRKHTRD